MRVLQLIDTLEAGGAERMAVNLANSLANYGVESHICATRAEGQLKYSLNNKTHYFFLNKKSTLDPIAVLKLLTYIKKNRINIIHAHGTSFFIATLVKIFFWNVKIVWHDHFGNRSKDTNLLKLVLLKFSSLGFSSIYCVNSELQAWAIKYLYCRKVSFVLNYPTSSSQEDTVLEGNAGKRILCLANLREPKNHQLLFYAFKELVKEYQDWSLHCVGGLYKDKYSERLTSFIKKEQLENSVFLYGTKNDVSHIISQCNIGVLASTYEGLPMALLEYGLGKLPVLATDVGYCGELILDSSLGILVPSNDINALHKGLLRYVENSEYRHECAKNFHRKISKEFSEENVIQALIDDYKIIIGID
jgi:glycosyltransferase involved in cell wall biosynthesis